MDKKATQDGGTGVSPVRSRHRPKPFAAVQSGSERVSGPPLYILAGGRSSRFGADKARAELDGRPLLSHILDALAPIAAEAAIVADRPGKYDDLAPRTIADRPGATGLGPLGGLDAALHDRLQRLGPGWLILCSCDLIRPDPRWFQMLLAACHPGRLAVAYRDQRWQPLIALYHTDLLDTVRRRIAAGQLAMRGLLDDPETRALPISPPDDWPERLQANRPEDLAPRLRCQRPEVRGQKSEVRNQNADL